MSLALHVLGVLLRWAVASPWHALGTMAAAVVLVLMLRPRSEPEQVVIRRGGLATVLVAAGALLTGWWFLAHPQKQAAAAAPKPVTRTVYVHQTVTRVIHAAGHSGLPPWAIVVIVVVVLGAVCGMTLGRSSS